MNGPKRIALIGHRGVGKTSLLSRIEKAYRSAGRRARVFDLDKEIEQSVQRSVSQIFQDDGEAVFRRLEQTTFEKLEKEILRTTDDVYVALGAGFSVAQLSTTWRAVWIRRATDDAGRIFTDRPRLDAGLRPLEEYKSRAVVREPKFSERADAVLTIDEGTDDIEDPAEQDYFLDRITSLGGALTLMPENFARAFETWIVERLAWGVRWFELRDDLLGEDLFARALKVIPASRTLISFRNVARQAATLSVLQSRTTAAFDWPSERGEIPAELKNHSSGYLSLHERGPDFQASLDILSASGSALGLKAALITNDFAELMRGHAWQTADPSRRSFLPMSPDGRWAWYRLLRQRRSFA